MTFSLQLGPFHPAFSTPARLTLQVHGTTVKAAGLTMGYNHRGVESLATSRGFEEGLGLMERLCSCSGYTHSLAFAQALESISSVVVPARARFVRTLFAELERLQAHLHVLARCADLVGLSRLAGRFWQLREHLADIVEVACGNRLKLDMVTFGGVRADIAADEVSAAVEAMKEPLYTVADKFIHSSSVTSRAVGVGVLTLEDAVAQGVVGPVARASGLPADLRKRSPYAAYGELSVSVVRQTGGDVFSRLSTRLLECFESVRLIEQVAQGIPDGPFQADGQADNPNGEGVGRAEGPAGECFHFVLADGSERPRHLRIRSASYANLPVLEKLLVGQDVEDVPLIVASLDPCFACAER